MAFINYWSQLLGHVPRVDPLLAQQLTVRAWNNIKNSRQWSWLRGIGVLNFPASIATGTVTTTQFANTMVVDAAADAVLNGINNPFITSRQIRIAQGPLYNITGYNHSTRTITLDRLYMEPGVASQPYACYRAYFKPQDQNGADTSDFQTFRSILNPIEGYAIEGANLRMTRMELDARDPTRGAFDMMYNVASYGVDSTGIPIFEGWPHTTIQRAYITLYSKLGPVISDNQDIPVTISQDLLVEQAMMLAYEWAAANAGRFPELKGVNWTLLKAEKLRNFNKMYIDARRIDDNIITDSWIPRLRDYLTFPPIDARFWQSHDVSGWFQG